MVNAASVAVPRKRRAVLTGFGVFLFGMLGFLAFFGVNFKTVEVSGESMEPTFESGRRLLMSRAYWLVGEIKKNDIVVIKSPEDSDTVIKRVKGLPGDVINFMDIPDNWELSQGEYRVPPGTVYVLGDNRPVSQDSRSFGPVETENIQGKVVIYGTEPWLYGVVGFAVLSVVASGVASLFDQRREGRLAR